MRRVVTGHDSNGKAIVASDETVDAITLGLVPGAEFHRLWGGNETPSFPTRASCRRVIRTSRPFGGFRFGMFSVAPASEVTLPADFDVAEAFAEMEQKLPGLAGHMEPDAPGMHTTATIDFEVVLEGEVWLELDDGEEVHLRVGDCVVQNGTRHAWRNRGLCPPVSRCSSSALSTRTSRHSDRTTFCQCASVWSAHTA